MAKDIEINGFFTFTDEGVTLSEYGMKGTKKILAKFSGGQIKEIGGVSRSALVNYVSGANRISKRGQDALKKLIYRFNNDLENINNSEKSTQSLKLFSDRELLEELKSRGLKLFVSV